MFETCFQSFNYLIKLQFYFPYFSSDKYFFRIPTNFSSKLYKSLLLYHFSISHAYYHADRTFA
nr:MAG TPA: hypothetical protein [Caudoviricetes sp.]